jgi:hypothetical protein
MTFTDALSAIFNDSDRITRQHWNSRSIYCELVDSQLCIVGFSAQGKDDGLPHPWVITEQDYFADDWEVVVDA